MAAEESQGEPRDRKPSLRSSIEAFQDVVSAAVIIPKEDGVISVSEDRTIRVWLKRDSGQYWPSVYHTMASSCTCMSFNPETRRLSIGMDTGTSVFLPLFQEFFLSEDYNKMIPSSTFQAHQGKVSVVLFVLEMEWLLSTGQDKSFSWHCSESRQQLGTHRTSSWVSGLQFDVETRHAFVGDQSGQVTILKLEQDSCSLVTTFKGHTGNVTALAGILLRECVFRSSDHSIIMWDIGGRKGTAIELQGHSEKIEGCVTPLTLDSSSPAAQTDPSSSGTWTSHDKRLLSGWTATRVRNKIGLRQHHCRKCGQAVCGKCSSKRSSIPLMGFEFEVRVCDSCFGSITDEDRAPTATFHHSKHNVVYMHYEPTTGCLLTSGTDKVIKQLEVFNKRFLVHVYINSYYRTDRLFYSRFRVERGSGQSRVDRARAGRYHEGRSARGLGWIFWSLARPVSAWRPWENNQNIIILGPSVCPRVTDTDRIRATRHKKLCQVSPPRPCGTSYECVVKAESRLILTLFCIAAAKKRFTSVSLSHDTEVLDLKVDGSQLLSLPTSCNSSTSFYKKWFLVKLSLKDCGPKKPISKEETRLKLFYFDVLLKKWRMGSVLCDQTETEADVACSKHRFAAEASFCRQVDQPDSDFEVIYFDWTRKLRSALVSCPSNQPKRKEKRAVRRQSHNASLPKTKVNSRSRTNGMSSNQQNRRERFQNLWGFREIPRSRTEKQLYRKLLLLYDDESYKKAQEMQKLWEKKQEHEQLSWQRKTIQYVGIRYNS
ncbi:hypothetical protein WMY93_001796 [Mugilogobius chulae]|uniref:FYVE-type domain-containing protein n=1 Tax=Mugilogobius chulae TaxID=88201 RepID=A0AAW0PSD9_9GOBI